MKGLKEGDKAILIKDFNPWPRHTETSLPKGTLLTIRSDDSNNCYLVEEYSGNFDCDALRIYSPDAPADKPHKFKVGERVRKNKHSKGKDNVPIGNIGEIVCPGYGDYDYEISYEYPFNGHAMGKDDWLEKVEEKFTNTIIINITSPEQHKRVQEKLFGMGYCWNINSKDVKIRDINVLHPSFHDSLSTYEDGHIGFDKLSYFVNNHDYAGFTFIPASEFLMTERSEEKPESKRPEMLFYDEASNVDWTSMFDGRNIIVKSRNYGKSLINELNNYKYPPSSPRTGDGIKNIMNSVCGGLEACANGIVDFAKNLVLSDDEKLLRKQGLHDQCGNSTFNAERLVILKLIKDNEPYLLEIAKAKEEEDKANKS